VILGWLLLWVAFRLHVGAGSGHSSKLTMMSFLESCINASCCAGNNGNKVIAPSYLNGTNQENGTTIAAQAEPSNAEIPEGGTVVCKLEMVTNHMRTSTLDHLQKATSNGLTCSSKTDVVAECPEPVWPLFLSSSWRAKLCQCPQCLNMYKEKGVSFLLNREDTIQVEYGQLPARSFVKQSTEKFVW